MPAASVTAHLDGVRGAHRALQSTIDGIGDSDLTVPSLLPGWSRAHVLAHLAANAESFVRIVDAAGRGETVVQYEGGAEGRAAGIESGARMPGSALLDRVRASAAALEATFEAASDAAWNGEGASVAGARIPVADVPFRRWREVEVHHADLGLSYGHGDWPARFVREELQVQEMRVLSRSSMGLTRLPAAVLALPPRVRLAWMLGRHDVDGVAPPEPF